LSWLANVFVLTGAVVALLFLYRPAMRLSETWRATVTPLASIIGSGFLVVAPILGHTVGNWAALAMLAIVLLAYSVGAAVRYNIEHVEKSSDSKSSGESAHAVFMWMERFAKIALAVAYVIAITFYLELLAAFVLHLFELRDDFSQKLIASTLIVFIGIFGYWRGLHRLELLEKYSVDIKLVIIAGLLFGLVFVNMRDAITGTWSLSALPVDWGTDTVRKLLGAFLIVQGFETSRYMGSVYSAKVRITTMRYAQLLSGAIYLVFIGLASILLGRFESISETGIIELSSNVAFVMPFMLVIGAVMAQFSAAVADTLASGGLVEAATYEALNHRKAYLALMVFAVALLWSSHIFSIIAYASRAFAGYYAIQCAMAATHAALPGRHKPKRLTAAFFACLCGVMVLTAIFGIPAETIDS
jgi:hypothetical protein